MQPCTFTCEGTSSKEYGTPAVMLPWRPDVMQVMLLAELDTTLHLLWLNCTWTSAAFTENPAVNMTAAAFVTLKAWQKCPQDLWPVQGLHFHNKRAAATTQ
jgi:hypothetical protein